METRPLYRLHWEYRERWRLTVPSDSPETVGFAYVEGTVAGAIDGRFRGVNHARQRSDARFLTDVQGVIATADGALMVDYQGYGCPFPRTEQPRDDRTRVVVAARHWTDLPEWEGLNDAIAVGVGENRFTEDGTRLLVLDVHEVVWEPLDDGPTDRPSLPDVVTIAAQPFDLDRIEAARRAVAPPTGG